MTNDYNDEQRVKIAKKEYDNLKFGKELRIDGVDETIGYVSQVNDKPSGEQSFVITDTFVPPTAPIEARNQVQELTVLYKGSTAPTKGNVTDKNHEEHDDLIKDWIHNDIPIGFRILQGGGSANMPQLKSSTETLKNAMNLYPNGQVFVYDY